MYLDEATLADPTKNVRGGNPVLFPSPGPLPEDRFTWHGTSGSMKQHGVARQRAFTVVSKAGNEAVLELTSDDATRAEYPWDFTLRIRYALEGTRLTIESTITNGTDRPMPFAYGFHPYFAVRDADKAKTYLETSATRAFDNVKKSTGVRSGPVDLTRKEVDLHLVDHEEDHMVLLRADKARIVVTADRAFGRWVVWTLAGKDFVCVEPWTAAGGALAKDDPALLVLDPHAARTLSVSIALG